MYFRLNLNSLVLLQRLSVLVVSMAVLGVYTTAPVLAHPHDPPTSCPSSSVRWSASSNRIYVSGANTDCTIPELHQIADKANLYLVEGEDSAAWYLGSNILLQDGATLNIKSPEVDQLRMKSNNTGSPGDDIVFIRANFGTVKIQQTQVTSWDEAKNGPDTEYGANKRSYIQVKSFLDGSTARESRMDIIDSDIGYLGYAGAEAYGLSWKVLGQGPSVYDQVDVFGDIQNSRIHHNYFGVYAFGLFGGQWTDNEVDHNVVYGLDPHDDSDELLIANNNVHHNGSHGIICSQRCDTLNIRDNFSGYNGGTGVMLHRNTDHSIVEGNKVDHNGDAGIAVFDSHNNIIRDNTGHENRHGIRVSVGSSENSFINNLFDKNEKYGVFFYKGSDAPSAGDGRPKNNLFEGNRFLDNVERAMNVRQSDSNDFIGNTFTNNGKDVLFDDVHHTLFEGNTVSGNTSYGVRFKNGSTVNVVADNVVTNNTKIGIYLTPNSDANDVIGNTVSGHSQYGIRMADSSHNTGRDNTVDGNRRGIGVTNGAHSNMLISNEIINNTDYPIYADQSSGNMFIENVTHSNGKYYYAKNGSDNEIRDVASAAVKVADPTSRWHIVGTDHRVLHNNKNVPTQVEGTETLVDLTQAASSVSVEFSHKGFIAEASSGSAKVTLNRNYGSSGSLARWVLEASGSTGLDYSLSNFAPNSSYGLFRDGTLISSVQADGVGTISFGDSVAGSGVYSYQLKAI